MSFSKINIGNYPDDPSAESFYSAFDKINKNIAAATFTVDCYTDLRNVITSETVVYVAGYAVRGDGGCGLFKADLTDTTSVDDNGLVLVGVNGTRWKRIYANFISVKWFGAVGDNTHDDTIPLQNALNAVRRCINANNKFAYSDSRDGLEKVYMPRGMYKITDSLKMFCGTILEGECAGAIYGACIVQYNYNKVGIYILPKNYYPDNTPINYGNGIAELRSLSMRNITVNDTQKNSPLIYILSSAQATVLMGNLPHDQVTGPGTIDLYMKDVWFQFSAGSAIYADDSVLSFQLINCVFDVCRLGIEIGGTVLGDLRLTACQFYGNIRGAVRIESTNPFELHVRDTWFRGCGNPGNGDSLTYWDCIYVKNTTACDKVPVIIDNCYFIRINDFGPDLRGPIRLWNKGVVKFQNNVVFDCDNGNNHVKFLQCIECSNVLIQNNLFRSLTLATYYNSISNIVDIFTMPAVGATGVMHIDSNVWVTINTIIKVDTLGFLYVTNVNVDGVHITVRNDGATSNAAPGTVTKAGDTIKQITARMIGFYNPTVQGRLNISGNIFDNQNLTDIFQYIIHADSIYDECIVTSNYFAGNIIDTIHPSISLRPGVIINNNDVSIYRRSDLPVGGGGTYKVGDIIYNTLPISGGYVGWVCITGGAPGVWKTFGLIS